MAANAVWDGLIPDDDLRTYEAAGYGVRQGPGARPALLVVDVTRGFVGDRGLSLALAVEQYRNSCGPAAWAAMPAIARLLDAARAAAVPVFYTRGRPATGSAGLGRWGTKNNRAGEDIAAGERIHEIVPEVGPVDGDVVVEKEKPSAFFGTPLAARLIGAKVDTVVVAGCTTSGCVRATVIDAFSHNYAVVVASDAVFDRGSLSHAVNLFDMHAKYADVQPTESVVEYLAGGRTA